MVLFWGVGAYNRLMRLRAEANTAFSVLDGELARQVALVRECLPVADATQPAPLDEEDARFWSGLDGAATQFSASLNAARSRPLDPESIAALAAAQDVLDTAWERAERNDAHDLAGSRFPENLSMRRQQIMTQARTAIDQFDLAVARYNDAIAQVPAVLLSWLFGFKPARGMRIARPTNVA